MESLEQEMEKLREVSERRTVPPPITRRPEQFAPAESQDLSVLREIAVGMRRLTFGGMMQLAQQAAGDAEIPIDTALRLYKWSTEYR